jgi:site-specific recombinase XerD
VLAALASSPATKALDPDPFPRHSLRHAVYAALLHFGFETALANGGALEHAQEMVAHKSPRTTKLYDRTKERLTQDEVERIRLQR